MATKALRLCMTSTVILLSWLRNYRPNTNIHAWCRVTGICKITPQAWEDFGGKCHLITMTSSWARWRPKPPVSPLFTQPFIQAQIKENIKVPRHWPLCGEFTIDRWIPRTHKWPVTRKMFPFDDVIMETGCVSKFWSGFWPDIYHQTTSVQLFYLKVNNTCLIGDRWCRNALHYWSFVEGIHLLTVDFLYKETIMECFKVPNTQSCCRWLGTWGSCNDTVIDCELAVGCPPRARDWCQFQPVGIEWFGS